MRNAMWRWTDKLENVYVWISHRKFLLPAQLDCGLWNACMRHVIFQFLFLIFHFISSSVSNKRSTYFVHSATSNNVVTSENPSSFDPFRSSPSNIHSNSCVSCASFAHNNSFPSNSIQFLLDTCLYLVAECWMLCAFIHISTPYLLIQFYRIYLVYVFSKESHSSHYLYATSLTRIYSSKSPQALKSIPEKGANKFV